MKRLEYAFLAFMLLAVLAVGVSEVHDFDTFWQLQSGKHMVETRQFIRTDLFTLVPDVPRWEHCWLHDLILYGLYVLGGYAALSVWKGVLLTATAMVLAATARVRGASLPAIAMALPVILLTAGGWTERPQLWTFLLFALFLLLLERYCARPSRQLLLLVPLAALWSNLHAGSVLAVAVLAACLAGEGGEWLWRRTTGAKFPRFLAMTILLAVAGLLLNPYPDYWLRTLTGIHQLGASVGADGEKVGTMATVFNADWTPTTVQNSPWFFYGLAVTAGVMLLGWRQLSLRDLCLMGGLALMGLKLVRHTSFFFFAMVAILPIYLDAAVDPLRRRLPARILTAGTLLVMLLAIAWGWRFYQPLWRIYGPFNPGLRSWHFPVAAAEFIKQQQLQKNLYNTYDWGGYLEWTLFPDYLVFWDSRQDSDEMFRLGWEAMAGKPSWRETFARFNINTVVTRPLTIDTGQRYPLLDMLRQSPEWRLVHADASSLVFIRHGSMPIDWLDAHQLPPERIDDTILATALLMTEINPFRFMAWYEMAQVHLRRREMAAAKSALEKYLSLAPERDPVAERTWMMLQSMTESPAR